MNDLRRRYFTETNQANWMSEDTIAHWAAWYCVNVKDDNEVRELITTQFACWKYLKERKTNVQVSKRMEQRAAEFDAFLEKAKREASEEAINAYLSQAKYNKR